MLPDQPIIAVLGTGSIGSRHLDILNKLGIQHYAIPIRSERKQELTGASVPCADSLEHAKKLGANAVIIATETSRHVTDVREALLLDYHVLCEKPIAISVDQACQLKSIIQKTKCHLFVAYCLRHDPGLQQFKKMRDTIGQIHSVRIECRSYLPEWRTNRDFKSHYSVRSQGGGVLLDLSHEIDYCLWIFGRPKTVLGEISSTSRLDIETEEWAEAMLLITNDCVISIGLDYLTRSPVRFIQAYGATGSINYDFISRQITIEKCDGKKELLPVPEPMENVYINQIKEFITLLQTGKCHHLVSFNDAFRVLLLIDAWRQSSVSGSKVEVSH